MEKIKKHTTQAEIAPTEIPITSAVTKITTTTTGGPPIDDSAG
jgi:hypothetical protein